MLLDVGCETVVVYLDLTNIVADDEALTKIFAAKGASALLPCLSCKNVLAAGRDCGSSGYFVGVDCLEVSQFDCGSDEDFFARMDAVNNARKDWENGTDTKKNYESLEVTMGTTSNIFGLLAAPDLRDVVRPAKIITHDIQHICFCGGVVGIELHQFLLKLKAAVGLEPHHIRDCLKANWSFPCHRKTSGAAMSELFCPARMDASNAASRFKGQASELLGVYTMLRHIVVEHIGKVPARLNRVKKEYDSFMAMCDVCDSVRVYKACGWKSSADFLSTVQLYLRKFNSAYGIDGDDVRYAVPKHHKLLHTPRQIQRDGFMLDNWTTERKNGIVKKAFEHTHNNRSWMKKTPQQIPLGRVNWT